MPFLELLLVQIVIRRNQDISQNDSEDIEPFGFKTCSLSNNSVKNVSNPLFSSKLGN